MSKQQIRGKIEEEIEKNLEDIYINSNYNLEFNLNKYNKDILKIELYENQLTKIFMSKIDFTLNNDQRYYNEVKIHEKLIKILSENMNDFTE